MIAFLLKARNVSTTIFYFFTQVKHASLALLDFIKSNKEHLPRIGNEIVNIFEEHLLDDRVTSPLLNFLDVVLSSGCFQQLIDDPHSNFVDEIFRLVNIEIKGHKKLYKTISSINVFCHLIQVRVFLALVWLQKQLY